MQSNNSKQKIWAAARNAAAVVGLAMLVYSGLAGMLGPSGAATVHAQTDPFLSRRVDMIEQRLYSLESRISSMQTQVQPPLISTMPSTTQTDVNFLRTQLDGMRIRLGEVECGLLKLDERTLPAAQRRANRVGSPSDRCRDNFGTSITLSSRP